jgi:hypothetical protein
VASWALEADAPPRPETLQAAAHVCPAGYWTSECVPGRTLSPRVANEGVPLPCVVSRTELPPQGVLGAHEEFGYMDGRNGSRVEAEWGYKGMAWRRTEIGLLGVAKCSQLSQGCACNVWYVDAPIAALCRGAS